jgi:hypothetical protein
MPARAPIGLETAQDRLERLNKPVFTPNLDLDIPEGYTQRAVEAPVEAVDTISSEPTDELPDDLLEGYTVRVDDEEEDDFLAGYTARGEESSSITTDVVQEFIGDDGLVGLPVGVDAYTYSQNDMSERDELYNPIFDYVEDRFGIQAVQNKSRADIVDTFLNSRRGVAGGNTVRGVSEIDFLMDVKDDPERLLKAGKAYAIFEGMESLTGDGVTWGEFGEGVKDYTAAVLLDPINLVGGFLGKFIGGGTVKVGVQTAQKAAQKEITKQLLKGASEKVAAKAGTNVILKTSKQVAKEGTEEIAKFSANLAANKGIQKIMNTSALKEIGTATAVDAVANAGMEYLYQRSLVETNVQGEISQGAVGLAALSSMAMGGIQAGVILKRGTSNQALINQTLKEANPKDMVKDLKKSLEDYLKNTPEDADSWVSKVKKGEDITKGDTNFFIDLLLGVNDAEGKTQLKGLAQIMQEGGYFFVKRDEDDKMSNWIADFMKTKLDQDDINDLMSVFGGKAKRKNTKITPETFGNSFANKMNESARSMNSVMQVAKSMNKTIDEINLNDFTEDALGITMLQPVTLAKDRYKGKGKVLANISEIQNKFIRSLVSHPSTSALNVVGYGAAAGLDTSVDIVKGLLYGGKGMFQQVVGLAEQGGKSRDIGRQLILSGTVDRARFLFDPDMTYAAYQSALLKNTGAMDKLTRTLAGGVDIANTTEQMAKLGGLGSKLQGGADKYIDTVQAMTFVNAQDAFTKSQEFMYQMNKQIRIKFGQSYNEFYNRSDINKIRASQDYKQMEMDAVTKVHENTFSQTYKNKTKLGQLAGMIEDARNIPGLGFMIPFGKFFNNTIDFGIKNTPGLNFVAKASGKYNNNSYADLAVRGSVTAGIIYSMSLDENENRKMGLGLYDEVIDGQVVSQQYDYPISLFKAASRLLSYNRAGEEVPPELLTQIQKDFGGGGLTRNLTKTVGEFADFGTALLQAEYAKAGGEAGQIASEIGAQALSGFLRPIEPVDTVLGLALGKDQSPKDATQGNKFVGDSLKYLDTTAELLMGLTGSDTLPTKISAYGGEGAQQSTKNLGIRVQNLTNVQRLLNLIGVDQWKVNAPLSKDRKKMIPEAVNEYQRQMYDVLEVWATEKMASESFRNSSVEELRAIWNETVTQFKNEAKLKLITQYDGPQTTLRDQYDIMTKYKPEIVREAMEDLEFEGDLGDLSLAEIGLLDAELYNRKGKTLREADLGNF